MKMLHTYSVTYTIKVNGETVETKTFTAQTEDSRGIWVGWHEMRDRNEELGGRLYRKVTETIEKEEEYFDRCAFFPTRFEK